MSPLTEPTKLTLAKSFTWNETVWNPSMIQTALWLDAADASTVTTVSGAVSQWSDKSGNGRHFTQATADNRPVYSTNLQNGRNGITFTQASSHYLEQSQAFFSSAYCVMALHRTNSSTTGQSVIASRSTTSGNPINPQISISATNDSQFVIRDDAGVIASNSIASHPTNTWALHGGVRNGGSVQTFVNGTGGSLASTSFGAITPSNTLIGALVAGAGGIQTFYSGSIAEIIVGPVAERQRIEGYLAWKWGLTANLPAGHPYKTVGPTP